MPALDPEAALALVSSLHCINRFAACSISLEVGAQFHTGWRLDRQVGRNSRPEGAVDEPAVRQAATRSARSRPRAACPGIPLPHCVSSRMTMMWGCTPLYIPMSHRTALCSALCRLSISELPSPSQYLRRSPDDAKPEDAMFRRHFSIHAKSLGYLLVTTSRRWFAGGVSIRNLLHRAAFESPIRSETRIPVWHNPMRDGCPPPIKSFLRACRSFWSVRSPVSC